MSLVGTTVGRIRVVEALGRGGMGEIYVGYDETLKRKVALKAIRNERRLDAETKARFLREARMLSQLDHPSICRIHEYLEEGDTDFLVLELIAGKNLKQALDEDELDESFKLHVAERVTDALMAAHAKGIAHRDLKPENVMLTPEGGVKVLDFGLAFTVDSELVTALGGESDSTDGDPGSVDAAVVATVAATSGDTLPGQRGLGPPGLGQPDDVADTLPGFIRSSQLEVGPLGDVADTRPGLFRGARSEAAAEAQRDGPSQANDRYDRPAQASETFQTELGMVMGTVAYMSPEQARGERATMASDIYSLGLLLQELFTGELPYESGLDLMQMLLKVGNGETLPVVGLDPDLTDLINRLKSVAPESRLSAVEAAERLRWIRGIPARRLLRRLAAVLVILLLLVGLKYTFDLRRARNKAILASHEAEQARGEAEQVLELVVSLFAVSDPSSTRGHTVTARELLDAGAAKIAGELEDQPLSKARLMLTMGRVYRQLGLYEDSQPLLEEALEIRRQRLGEESLETAHSFDLLANLYHDQGDFDRAEPLFRRALEIRELLLGAEHLHVAVSLNNLGFHYRERGDGEAAEPLFQRALTIQQELLGLEHLDVATSLVNLGDLYRIRGDHERAEPLLRRALAVQEKLLPADHPGLAFSLNNLAMVHHEQGRAELAAPLFERTLAIQENVLGAEHPNVATSLNNLAELYRVTGEYSLAEPLYQRALTIQEKALGEDHPRAAITLSNLADLYSARGEPQRAAPLYQQVLAIQVKALGEAHPSVAVTLNHQADLYRESHAAAAEELYLRALEIQEATFGNAHLSVAITLADLADLYARQGRQSEAERLYLRSQISIKRVLAAEPGNRAGLRRLAVVRVGLGKLYQAAGAGERATESWTRAVALMEPLTVGSELVEDLNTHTLALLYLGRVDEARPMASRLLATGWADLELRKLCQQHGLQVEKAAA